MREEKPSKHGRFLVVAVIFIAALSVRLWGLTAMGNTWDEYFYYDAVRSYLHNVTTLDTNAADWNANSEHPPLGKYVYVPAIVWNHAVHADDGHAYDAPRAISALLGALTVVFVYLIGQRYWSRKVGITAALIFGLMPVVLGYSKIIDLDVSMVMFVTLAMERFMAWQKDNSSNRALWWSTLLATLAITCKFNASLIGIVYAGVLLAWWQQQRAANTKVTIPLPILAWPVTTVAVLYAIWPWLWSNPVTQFAATLNHWGGVIHELYFGHIITPGPTYFIGHFIVGTPLVVLLLFAVGTIVAFKQRSLKGTTLLLWFVAPFGMSFFHLHQDHLRYVLDAFPAVAILAAIGFWNLVERAEKPWPWVKSVAFSALTLYLIAVVVNIHPYYLNYYNVLIGGAKGVEHRNLFQIGFYGEGIKEATGYVNRTAGDGETVHYEIIPDDAPYLDRPRLTRLDQNGSDYLIFNQNAREEPKKSQSIRTDGYHSAYTVRAGGAPFVWVYQKDGATR